VDFHRPTSADGSHPELFNWVLEYFQKNDDFKPPLYLQHQGMIHSKTDCSELFEEQKETMAGIVRMCWGFACTGNG
jgi:hypothetical protein